MRIFSICKNAKLNNISFTFKVKLHIKHEEDKHKIQHNSDLSGVEKQTWEGDLGAQQSQLFLQLRAGYTDIFCDSLCLICTVYIFFRMYDMDSIITYFRITRSPDKNLLAGHI